MRLREYLPPYWQRIREFRGLWETEDTALAQCKAAIGALPRENAVLDCGEEALARWEALLKIEALGDVTQRKMFVLATLRGQGKLDLERINQIVNAFTGAQNSALVDFVDSRLRVRVLPPLWGEIYIFSQIEEALKPRIPAHICIAVEKYYHTWQDIKTECAAWQQVVDGYPTWEPIKTRLEEIGDA